MDANDESTVFLSPKQVDKLIGHAKKNSERDAIILSLMWKCGLKTNEVAGIRHAHINPEEQTIVVGKTNRMVPVERELMESLKGYASTVHANADEDTHVFVAQGTKNKLTSRRIQNMVRDYSRGIGLGDLTPNHIRKSFAAYFLKKTNDINALREMLGQKDLYTTQRYLGAIKKADIEKLYHRIWK
ncbi:MAG: tyrosine-type recombinase/integrase [Candidatus Micrarchaeota archaeon]